MNVLTAISDATAYAAAGATAGVLCTAGTVLVIMRRRQSPATDRKTGDQAGTSAPAAAEPTVRMGGGARTAHRISVALMGIAIIVTTGAGFAQSYAGLYHWALQHSLTGWKAQSFPLMVDLFILVGELGLFALALEGHQLTRRGMSWLDLAMPTGIAAAGWAVSLIFNIGAVHGLADRATHAVPPIASMLGLLVLLRTLHRLVRPAAGRPAESANPASEALFEVVRVPAQQLAAAEPPAIDAPRTAAPVTPPPARQPAAPAAPRPQLRAARPHGSVIAAVRVLVAVLRASVHSPSPAPARTSDRETNPHAETAEPASGRASRTDTPPAQKTRTRRPPHTTARTKAEGPADQQKPAQARAGDKSPAHPTREELLTELIQEIRTAADENRKWHPDYKDLEARSGYRRRWCESLVSEARTATRTESTPAKAARGQ